MTEKYVPQVGHLVERDGKRLIVSWLSNGLAEVISQHKGEECLCPFEELTFLADRSAEWQALFQLDNTNQPNTND